MNEIWKPIEGFEGYYEVSNTGRVRSCDRTIQLKGKRSGQTRTYKGRELKPLVVDDHESYHLQKQGQRVNISRGLLVAIHFLDGFKESGRKRVKYKDGNNFNCSIDNLE